MNKLKLVQQKYEPNLNLKSYLLMSSNLARVKSKKKKKQKNKYKHFNFQYLTLLKKKKKKLQP